jgi:hypothetical protein
MAKRARKEITGVPPRRKELSRAFRGSVSEGSGHSKANFQQRGAIQVSSDALAHSEAKSYLTYATTGKGNDERHNCPAVLDRPAVGGSGKYSLDSQIETN